MFTPLMVTVRFGVKGKPDRSWNLAEGRLLHAKLERGRVVTGAASIFVTGSEEINQRGAT